MVIRTRQNLYQGVNAHLHSGLQNEPAAWEVFHSSHIIHLAEAIDTALPPGYVVEPERSLQIREFDQATGERLTLRRTKRPRPDVTIYRRESVQYENPESSTVSIPTLTLPAIETIERDDDFYLTAIVIRQVAEGDMGRPVTWLELLSPTNKPPGEGYLQYREKRAAALEAGIVLVEIDYLHQTRSPVHGLPSYPDREAGSYPYVITVTDPKPSLEDGQMKAHGFGVDASMPILEVPLVGTDFVRVDFGAIYNRTYQSLGAYSYRVDYEELPVSLDTYSESDEQRIRAVMARAKTSG
jgi:hypothetical protein